MNELSLFTGAGGGLLGSHLMGWKTICAVEIENYPRRVLLARQKDGLLPRFPIWDDVTTFDGKPWRGRIDIVTGGFPCQDISCAGKGKGITGERSGLWGEMARIIGEVRPRYALMENSPVLVRRGLAVVISDLAEMGYACKWGIVGAHHAGGPHKRDRIWILANSGSLRRIKGASQEDCQEWQTEFNAEFGYNSGQRPAWCDLANTSNQGLQRGQQQTLFGEGQREKRGAVAQCCGSWWDIDPADLPDTDKLNDDLCRHGAGPVQRERQEQTEVSGCEIPDTSVRGENGWSRGISRGQRGQEKTLCDDGGRNREKNGVWPIKPGLGGMDDELAHWLDVYKTAFGGEVPRVGTAIPDRCSRLKAIGNGQVPMALKLAVEYIKPP